VALLHKFGIDSASQMTGLDDGILARLRCQTMKHNHVPFRLTGFDD
jgi:hypothetical protein